MLKDLTKLTGLTLKEYTEQYRDEEFRIVCVGDVTFVVTADLRKNRLNLTLDDTGVSFIEKKMKIGNKEFVIKDVDMKTIENARIIRAHFG